MIYSLVEAAIREAVAKPENQVPLDHDIWENGVNWNFVDADCYASDVRKLFKDDAAYYEAFDEVVWLIDIELTMKAKSQTDGWTQLELELV